MENKTKIGIALTALSIIVATTGAILVGDLSKVLNQTQSDGMALLIIGYGFFCYIMGGVFFSENKEVK